jgi:P27 family predicted phage terminase small subunit
MGGKGSGGRPKPTALRVIQGNPGKRALPKKEPKFKPALPSPPSHLNAPAKREWGRVAKELFDMGMLTSVDRGALAAYCQAYGRWVQAENALAKLGKDDELSGGLMIKTSNGNAIQNPIVGIANVAARDMVKFSIEFGMTPAARSRVQAGAPAEEDEAERFFA